MLEPVLSHRLEDGSKMPLLYWRLERPLHAISSAPLGGGMGLRHWLINATVPMSYRRDDPDVHLATLSDQLNLDGPGIGLLTGVDVAEVVTTHDDGVRCWATVGLGAPIWAAVEAPVASLGHGGPVGTVNIVVYVPVWLEPAALVNAVATATEAKAQAMWELGLAATGTATDAVTVLCPPDGPSEPYGGPRSRWGAPLARAVRAAVRSGGSAPTPPWSHSLRAPAQRQAG